MQKLPAKPLCDCPSSELSPEIPRSETHLPPARASIGTSNDRTPCPLPPQGPPLTAHKTTRKSGIFLSRTSLSASRRCFAWMILLQISRNYEKPKGDR